MMAEARRRKPLLAQRFEHPQILPWPKRVFDAEM
jgi:hypothetical protein